MNFHKKILRATTGLYIIVISAIAINCVALGLDVWNIFRHGFTLNNIGDVVTHIALFMWVWLYYNAEFRAKRLIMYYGADQEKIIDALLLENATFIINQKKKAAPEFNRIEYDILFTDTYSIYYFGYKQAEVIAKGTVFNYLK